MATRVRESGVRGKEKKGNQADNTMPQQHKRITTTTTASRLMSSSSSSVANNSVPNYLRPTTASAAVQPAGGDKPISSRRKSLDKPLLPNLETAHRNLAGDKPSPARRKSFDRPIQPPHSPLSSSPLSSSSLAPKPAFSRTKSSLENSKPKSSTTIMSRTSEANDRRGKIISRSISSVSKSSSSSSPIAHNNHLLNRPTTPKTPHKNSTRKQPGTTLMSPKPVKKKPADTIHILTSNHHQEPSVPIPESPDHHHIEVSANNPDSNQTEINNNNNNKIVQEKENINVVVSDIHEELEDNLKFIEDCSSLSSSIPEDPPILDPLDTITEEGEISAPENLQEIGETADTIPPPPEDHPQVEDKDINLKETTPAVDPNPADEVSMEEKGDDETIQTIISSSSDNNNCSEDKAENQEEEEEEEEREKEKEQERDKKPDNHHHHHHHQELADEEVKEITNDQNNNNNVVVVQSSSPEASKPVLKRNESVVSNDVIEETASKLREQRKNKVKALAGAFETVISLQDK